MTEKYGNSGEELVPDSIMLIEDSSELAAICESFSDETYITVDTEFMRESTYWPILCLVQIAGSKSAAVIDAMAPGIDLDPLLRLFKNRNILKVFHAGRQDLLLSDGRTPRPGVRYPSCRHGLRLRRFGRL